MKGKIILNDITGMQNSWRGDINNDGANDSIEFKRDCKSDGEKSVITNGRYVVHIEGVQHEEWGQFERLSGNEYIHRDGRANVSFFASDGKNSFKPNQLVYNKTSGGTEKIYGFVMEIRSFESVSDVKVQLVSGERVDLNEISPVSFWQGLLYYKNFL